MEVCQRQRGITTIITRRQEVETQSVTDTERGRDGDWGADRQGNRQADRDPARRARQEGYRTTMASLPEWQNNGGIARAHRGEEGQEPQGQTSTRAMTGMQFYSHSFHLNKLSFSSSAIVIDWGQKHQAWISIKALVKTGERSCFFLTKDHWVRGDWMVLPADDTREFLRNVKNACFNVLSFVLCMCAVCVCVLACVCAFMHHGGKRVWVYFKP